MAHWRGLRLTQVYRNDKTTLEEIESLSPSRIVLSPGPGHPSTDAGICAAVLKAWEGVSAAPNDTPTLEHTLTTAEGANFGCLHGTSGDV